MLRSIVRMCCLFLLLCVFLLPSIALASTTRLSPRKAVPAALPAVDPAYVYNQLFYVGTHFLRREAGYDNNLPPTLNGHDEFAAYWSQEMQKNLQGFGAQVRRDTFAVQGWVGRPTTVPAFNVEVSVPGVTHPEQVVVIGCHYDGEAVSTQSAFDDASGCAIELGVAKAMGAYWRSQHVYPARTLRFVIFDAEEQGLYGSFHYVNNVSSV
ncbi:MAG TPA: M28 family peptidase [Ktedonobacteraceae bacterium]|nr:M28 family peptidase [Ktedonobacteraceae bacterium]